jgi:hypothetical protein
MMDGKVLPSFQFIIYLTFYTKFDWLVLFKFCAKNKNFKAILKVFYMLNDITVKINNNDQTYGKKSKNKIKWIRESICLEENNFSIL